MKLNKIITVLLLLIGHQLYAQDVVPKAKSKADRKEERKGMTLEERIEDILPVDLSLPSASVKLPGSGNISSVEEAKKYMKETLPGYGAEVKAKSKKARKELEKAKEKLFNGKEYEGLAVDKQLIRRGSGSRMRYTEFYTLKEYENPSPYVKEIYWFDTKTSRVVNAQNRDKSRNVLMHGPYKEYVGESLMKEGFYYKGMKHGRWVSYDKDFILLDKTEYSKGFLEDAEISYYDEAAEKIKEVIPMQFGEQTGDYLLFHENGTLATEGQYDKGKRVGTWIEYYQDGNKRKKETRYGTDCYDTTPPLVVREYSPTGEMTFEHESVKR